MKQKPHRRLALSSDEPVYDVTFTLSLGSLCATRDTYRSHDVARVNGHRRDGVEVLCLGSFRPIGKHGD